MVELYFHSPIRLHGGMLNQLRTGAVLPIPFKCAFRKSILVFASLPARARARVCVCVCVCVCVRSNCSPNSVSQMFFFVRSKYSPNSVSQLFCFEIAYLQLQLTCI
jgi:hypothetical protein